MGEQIFIGYYTYVEPPKGFFYKKAKEIYKQEVIKCIEETMKEVTFPIAKIGIQYFNEGYSMLDVNIGMDDGEEEDVLSMRYSGELIVSADNRELLEYLNSYMNANEYYKAFRKMMKEVKEEIENIYRVEVILDEICD